MAASVAGASRGPTASEKTAIARSVQGFFSDWYYGSGSTIRVHVGGIRISSADPNWARAAVSGPKVAGRQPPAASAPVLLWHAPGSPHGPSDAATRQWVVVSPRYSAEYAWCGIAPPRVTVDLGANYGC
jgi:hypothetical protein